MALEHGDDLLASFHEVANERPPDVPTLEELTESSPRMWEADSRHKRPRRGSGAEKRHFLSPDAEVHPELSVEPVAHRLGRVVAKLLVGPHLEVDDLDDAILHRAVECVAPLAEPRLRHVRVDSANDSCHGVGEWSLRHTLIMRPLHTTAPSGSSALPPAHTALVSGQGRQRPA